MLRDGPDDAECGVEVGNVIGEFYATRLVCSFYNYFRRISLIYNPILWHTVAPYSIALHLAYVGDWKSAGDAD